MITRSRRDSNYEFLELPEKKRQKKQPIIEEVSTPTPAQEPASQPSSAIPISVLNHYLELQSEISIHTIPYKPLYEVNIDFDEAHAEWVKNKIKMPNGCYRYRKERSTKRNKKTM